MSNELHYVYILKCNDNTYYTGYTKDIKKRVKIHNEGKGAKYTRGRGPHQLVYTQSFETKGEALRNEYKIKQLSRKEKEMLIAKESRKINDSNPEKL